MRNKLYKNYLLTHTCFSGLTLCYFYLAVGLREIPLLLCAMTALVVFLLTVNFKEKFMVIINGLIYVFGIGIYLMEAIASSEMRLYIYLIAVVGLLALFSAKHYLQ
jgi:hypothetical protein